MTALAIILVLIVLFLLWLAVAYNGLVTLKNRTDEAWADIDVQLKRRYDLVPNLIESVKGYIKQEKDVLTEVTEARANAIAAGGKGAAAQSGAENMLSGALRSVFAVAENYPDLKSSANFQQFSSEVSDIEDKIQAARRFYNANVRDFNIKIEVIPTSFFAKSLGFMKRDLFTVEDPAQREAVKADFTA
jgi:LemA protein